MKKILFLLMLILSFASCKHTFYDKAGKVVSVKESRYRSGNDLYLYKVKVHGMDVTAFFETFSFRTNTLYQVGDTIYIGQINNQEVDSNKCHLSIE